MAAAPKACTTSSVSRRASSPSAGASRMPDRAAKQRADHPGLGAHPGRARPGEVEQVGVVDDAPHGDAELGEPEEASTAPTADTRAMTIEIIWSTPTLTPANANVSAGQERREGDGRRPEDGGRRPRHDQQQPDGGDDLGRRRGVGQAPGDPLGQEPGDRRHHEDHEQRGQRPGHVVAGASS